MTASRQERHKARTLVADPVEGTNPGDAERRVPAGAHWELVWDTGERDSAVCTARGLRNAVIDAFTTGAAAGLHEDEWESAAAEHADEYIGAVGVLAPPAPVSGDERLREERDRLADVLYSAHEFVQGVRDWTGENPEERDELLAAMDAALASLSVSSPEREEVDDGPPHCTEHDCHIATCPNCEMAWLTWQRASGCTGYLRGEPVTFAHEGLCKVHPDAYEIPAAGASGEEEGAGNA